MVFFQSLVCWLIPGMLLGFGLAVLPRRELLGRSVSPRRRRLLKTLPERSLTAGWLLAAGTLLLRWGGTGTAAELVAGRCVLLDLMALGGLGAWTVLEPRTRQKNSVCGPHTLANRKFGKIYKIIF